jgi:hypothetical protein
MSGLSISAAEQKGADTRFSLRLGGHAPNAQTLTSFKEDEGARRPQSFSGRDIGESPSPGKAKGRQKPKTRRKPGKWAKKDAASPKGRRVLSNQPLQTQRQTR